VLYEMLTGRRAFDGADMATTLASVLKDDVRWDAVPPVVPTSVRRLLRRCLEKDPKRRLSAIADARLELDDAAIDVSDGPVTSSSGTETASSRRRIIPMALATILGLVIGGAVVYLTRPSAEPSRAERFVVSRVDAPPELASSTPSVWMSPDGARLVYRTGLGNARTPLLMRDRSTFEPTVIIGTEGGVNAFFSPDGKWVGFFDDGDRTLKRMPVVGGPSQVICKVDGQSFGASWGADDQIVFATLNSKGLMRVSASGGEPQVLTRIDTGEAAHFWPDTLPGGQGVLFTIWNGSPERARIAVASKSDGHVSTLVVGGTYPRYAYNGYLLFVRAGKLWTARFDATRLTLLSDPTPVVDDVALTPYGGAHYAVGVDGSLVYATGRQPSESRALVWVDRQGRQEPINLPPRPYAAARVSPDGTKLALDIRDEQNDIWIWDLTTETLQNLTLDPGDDRLPVWTPDGSHVAFDSERDGGLRGIFWRRADGSEPVERIDTGTRSQAPTSFSPDGKRLIALTPMDGSSTDIGLLDLGNPPRETMLVTSPFAENNGVVSPDGRWLAYESNESGRLEIYVRPFPDVATSRQLVSSGGGSRPLWSKDGRELFYWVDPGTVMTVPVKLGATLTFGKPMVAVKGPYVRPATVARHFDISGDGKRFLLMKEVDSGGKGKPTQPEVRLVLHFADELGRLVGRNR
jgi:Tol biopolymer transport system component